MVGRSGICAMRALPVTASPRSLPPLIWGIASEGLAKVACTSPETVAAVAGAPPL